MKRIAIFRSVALALLVAACGSPASKPKPVAEPRSTGTATIPARSCLAEGGPDRAACVTLLGALRTVWQGSTVCSPVPLSDLSDSYAVMDWIRDHPEVNDEELGDVAERVLVDLHPC